MDQGTHAPGEPDKFDLLCMASRVEGAIRAVAVVVDSDVLASSTASSRSDLSFLVETIAEEAKRVRDAIEGRWRHA